METLLSRKWEKSDRQDERIDHYWQSVFKLKTLSGTRKYPLLAKLVKSVLSLHHGNSAVERSLSDNKNTVTTLSWLIVGGVVKLQIFWKKTPQAHLIIIREWPKNTPPPHFKNSW